VLLGITLREIHSKSEVGFCVAGRNERRFGAGA